jgi:hypothetical protein
MTRLLAVLLVISVGCAGTIEITGGPNNATRMNIKRDGILEQIRPLVAGDARAMRRLEEVAAREQRGKILLYSQLALTLGCIAIPAGSSDPLAPSSATYAGIGLCVTAIAVGIAAFIVLPKMGTYGEPLRVYNEGHAEAPFVAPDLKVTPPPRRLSGL